MKRSYVELNINGTVSNDGLESADQFNKFFTKSVEELATNFQPIEFDDIQRDLSTSFHIEEVKVRLVKLLKSYGNLRLRIILDWIL